MLANWPACELQQTPSFPRAMSALSRFADEQPNAEQQQYVQQHFQALRSLVKPKVVRVRNPI